MIRCDTISVKYTLPSPSTVGPSEKGNRRSDFGLLRLRGPGDRNSNEGDYCCKKSRATSIQLSLRSSSSFEHCSRPTCGVSRAPQ